MNFYTGLVAITHSDTEFTIESTRGSKNFKGFKVENGKVGTTLYVVPRSFVKDTRPKHPHEMVQLIPVSKIDLGTVITLKKPFKDYPADAKFVVFKLATDGLSFSAVLLGGDPKKRFLKGLQESAVNVVEV